jgi:hypothetical protein
VYCLMGNHFHLVVETPQMKISPWERHLGYERCLRKQRSPTSEGTPKRQPSAGQVVHVVRISPPRGTDPVNQGYL